MIVPVSGLLFKKFKFLIPDKRGKEDRQIGSIAAVFDELKDYLSDSDLSLDYKIALRRRKNRSNQNTSNQNWSNQNWPNKSEAVSSHQKYAIEYSG